MPKQNAEMFVFLFTTLCLLKEHPLPYKQGTQAFIIILRVLNMNSLKLG